MEMAIKEWVKYIVKHRRVILHGILVGEKVLRSDMLQLW